jgi:predicted amidohydrolase YtcJ
MLIIGDCLTMDEPARVGAVRIDGGRIVDLGPAADLRARYPGEKADVFERVTPGIHDAHAHVLAWGQALGEIDLGGLVDPRQIADRVAVRAATVAPGTWICGRGYLLDHYPDSGLLDAAAPDNPVLVECRDMHSAWANQAALERAGVDAGSSDPEAGRFVRDPAGRPTGYLLERAVQVVREVVPPPGPDELLRGLRDFADRGYVAVHDLGWGSTESLDWATDLALSGRLPLRLWWSLSGSAWEGVEPGRRGDDLEVAGAKLFADGSLGSRTAWMHEPYRGGDCGMPLQPLEEIRDNAGKALSRGYTPTVHAIGSRAVAGVIEIFAELAPRSRRRLRLEHAQHIRDRDLLALAELPAVASMQPSHLPGDVPFIRSFLPGREAEAFRFRDLDSAGVTLAFGSDAPVLAPDLGTGLTAATGHPLDSAQSLSPERALRAFTRGAAEAAGWDDSGVLVRGARADLALWEGERLVGRVWKGLVVAVG